MEIWEGFKTGYGAAMGVVAAVGTCLAFLGVLGVLREMKTVKTNNQDEPADPQKARRGGNVRFI